MKITSLPFIILLFASFCFSQEFVIEQGTFRYAILMNNTRIGTADFTTEVKRDRYITRGIMKFNIGDVTNSIEESVEETREFKAIRTELHNTIIKGNYTTAINTIAEFNGNRVTVTGDKAQSTFILKEPFYLNGNYFSRELMKRGLVKGSSVSAHLYYPFIEIDATVKVTMKVIGKEKITIKGILKELYHLELFIEGSKQQDIYINEKGIAEKSTQKIFDNSIDLVLR